MRSTPPSKAPSPAVSKGAGNWQQYLGQYLQQYMQNQLQPPGMSAQTGNTLSAVYGNPNAGLQALQAQFPTENITPQTAGNYTSWLTNA